MEIRIYIKTTIINDTECEQMDIFNYKYYIKRQMFYAHKQHYIESSKVWYWTKLTGEDSIAM